ncbi:hypothetical protein GCM10025868_45930 [Angustibacter aerolatus]|uniref:Major facilitator superfamily (MFS) profile domain-containing protein n=1 Tax=Angustibacter aerolatus TaxID=1162965 RepID=A0ABQ6JPM3_9ACTN|nr:hypothetical protein GCM10025868_45930 [Angustibacter aerolatus]
MVVLDGTIVNIALPHIQTDLDFSPANLSWVVNAYTLAFGGLLLLGGRAGDLLGRRKVFMAGVGLFALASLAGGIAQTSGQMLAARIVQGVGAAIASPTALSLITTTFPAGRERNRAFGVYAAMSGAGAAIGLILGGVLTEVDWRLTFFINVPIGALVLFMAPRFLGESDRETGASTCPVRSPPPAASSPWSTASPTPPRRSSPARTTRGPTRRPSASSGPASCCWWRSSSSSRARSTRSCRSASWPTAPAA